MSERVSGHPQGKSEKETEKEALRRHLSHYPRGAPMPSIGEMSEFARRLGEPIVVETGAMQRNDGWYVNLPDGRTERVANFRENPADQSPSGLYVVYGANSTVSVGYSRCGAVFQREWRNVSIPKPEEEAEGAGD